MMFGGEIEENMVVGDLKKQFMPLKIEKIKNVLNESSKN